MTLGCGVNGFPGGIDSKADYDPPKSSAIHSQTLDSAPTLYIVMPTARFHEGLLTVKSFPNVLVGFQMFWAETFSMLCSYDRFTSCLGILLLKKTL